MIGQYQIAQGRGFVGHAAERHLERHFRERRGEACRPGCGVNRIRVSHERDRHGAGGHALGGPGKFRIRRQATVSRMTAGRLDRDADASGLLVDVSHHRAALDGISRRDAADGHDTRARVGDGGGKRLNHRRRHARRLCSRGDRPLPDKRGAQRHIASRLGGDPLIGVEAGE